ncbi:MAG: PIN domain-containing protein [Waterburya sp.]
MVRKVAGRVVAQNAIAQILSDLNICAVDLNILKQAPALNFEDFEDAVQYACAVVHNLDAIVTRDLSGFVNAEIPVVLPENFDNISSGE